VPKPKKFVVNGKEYRVTIGGSNVKVSVPGERTLAPFVSEVVGAYRDTDGDEGFAVLPSNVVSWIRRNSWRFTMKEAIELDVRRALVDDILTFKGYNGVEGECGLKIWSFKNSYQDLLASRYVIVMTQLPDNKGLSVTNGAENIALEVMETYLRQADPDIITWIEHYPPRGNSVSVRIAETFDRVNMKFDGKRFHINNWTHLVEADLKTLGIL
jgi:hypothetical protein